MARNRGRIAYGGPYRLVRGKARRAVECVTKARIAYEGLKTKRKRKMKLVPATSAPWGNLSDWLMPESGGEARIATSANIFDMATVSGSAIVHGSARVFGFASVCGHAQIYDSTVISDSAIVGGSACVYGHARIRRDGDIRQTADYMVIQSVGNEDASLTIHRDTKIGVRVNRGCFSGTLTEFMTKLTDSPAHEFYRQIVPLMVEELTRRMTPLPLTQMNLRRASR
jgi:hypothetical protein